jgi:PqqD family protein of HPr-rel-A system
MEQGDRLDAYEVSSEAVIVDLDRETIVYHRGRNQLYVLNPSAAAIFRLCDGKSGEAEIAEHLRGSFREVPATQLTDDVRRTVGELVELGLVRRGSSHEKGDRP